MFQLQGGHTAQVSPGCWRGESDRRSSVVLKSCGPTVDSCGAPQVTSSCLEVWSSMKIAKMILYAVKQFKSFLDRPQKAVSLQRNPPPIFFRSCIKTSACCYGHPIYSHIPGILTVDKAVQLHLCCFYPARSAGLSPFLICILIFQVVLFSETRAIRLL